MESVSSQPANVSKKRTSRSVVWDHFILVEGCDAEDPKAKCMHCGQVYACHTKRNGTSNMTRHLHMCKMYLNSLDINQQKLSFVKKEAESFNSKVSTFTQEGGREHVAKMLIMEELPIRMVEYKSFKDLLAYFQPSFVMPSRRTIARDIEKIYQQERRSLKDYFKKSKQRVCLTTDTWTSGQNINYMVVTGHFIDGDWKLHKKILNFVQIDNHQGDTIGKIMEQCMVDWGIENVFTITVDNASSNDVAISYLVKSLRHWKGLVLDGECIHMRCFAHIVNLIVNDGLKEHQVSISRVQKAVKFVKSSPQRLQQFKNCIDIMKITFKGNVSLDVSTRWNSTYLMLQNAEKYTKAFEKLGETNLQFLQNMGEDGSITNDDLSNIREFCKFLKVFYDATVTVSASLHVTSNLCISEVCQLKFLIQEHAEGENMMLRRMAIGMLNKFDKYWGDFEKINSLMFVAVLLDPRCKTKFLKHCMSILIGSERVAESMQRIVDIVQRLYVDYKGDLNEGETSSESLKARKSKKPANILFSTFFEHSLDSGCNMSEVDEYLSDKAETYSDELDILSWWKLNSHKYPILSKIAKDVLIIPISTVASESAFSCGGRIVDSFRTSLLPTTLESIICTQSWLRSTPITLLETIEVEDYKTIDEEIAARLAHDEDGEEDVVTIIE